MRASKKILGVIAGASMLATTLGIGTAAFAASATYYDIYDLTTLAQTAINSLYQDGVMNGTAPGKFSPTGAVTRAQAVKFVVNALGLQLQYPRTASYTDVTSGSQYYPYIETALNAGLLNGFAGSSGAFNPSEKVSRIDLAILEINALGDQSLATSMATDTTTYFGKGKLTDAAKVPSGDLGYANAGMKLGLVPPLNSSLYSPNGSANREQFAVGLYRLYGKLAASAPASLKVAQSATSVGVGQVDNLTTTVLDAKGNTIPASQLAGYTISYSVTGSNASSATVSSNGTFVATASGNYTVEASISGGALKAPVTTTVTVGVYGTATALKVTPASASVVADNAATDTVTVDVVDANGNTVGSFDGAVTLGDTNNGTKILNASGSAVFGSVTVNAVNGVATFTVESSGTSAGLTDTLTGTASNGSVSLTAGTATVSTVAPTAAQLTLSASPSALDVNGTTPSTTVTLEAQDSAGVEYTGGSEYVTLTLTGPGSFSATTSQQTLNLYLDGVDSSIQVYGTQGDAGTIGLTATAQGVKSASLTVPAVVVGAADKLGLTTSTGTTSTGTAFTEYTVQLEDASGNPITNTTNEYVTITDNTSVTGGSLTYYLPSVSNAAQPGTAFTVRNQELTNGAFTFFVENTSTGTSNPTITVTDDTYGFTATAGYTYANGAPAKVAFTNSNTIGTAEAGQTLTFTAQLEDANGNSLTTSGENVEFSFASNSANATLPNGSAAVNTDYIVPTNAQGVATVTVAIPAGQASGSFVLNANVVGGSLSAAVGPTITVEPASNFATAIAFDSGTFGGSYTWPATLGAGNAVSGTPGVSLENAVGTAVTSGDQLTVTTSNPAVLALGSYDTGSTTTKTITASTSTGVAALPTITGENAGTATITVTDISNPQVKPITATITVEAGAVTGGAIYYQNQEISSTNKLAVTANTPVAIQVVNVDAGGNPVPVTSNETNGASGETFSLSDPNGGSFRLSPTGANIQNVTIPQGEDSVTVYYLIGTTGSYYGMAASAPVGLSGVTASPSSTSPTTGASDNVTLALTGTGASTFNGTLPITVSGATNSPNGTAATLPTTATFTNGSATVPVVLTNAAAQTLTFTVQGKSGSTAAITPVAGLTTLSVSTQPSTGTAGTAQTFALTASDAYGNPFSGTVTLASSPTANDLSFSGTALSASPNNTAATAPTGTVVFTNGTSAAIHFTPTDAQTGAVITATYGTGSSAPVASSSGFNITAGAAGSLALSTPVAASSSPYTNSITVGNITDADGNVIVASSALVSADFAVGSSSSNTVSSISYNASTGVLSFVTNAAETSSDTWTVTYTNTSQITNPSNGIVTGTHAG